MYDHCGHHPHTAEVEVFSILPSMLGFPLFWIHGDNDPQLSYGCPPHKLDSSWWLTMIEGYGWFAADRKPLTRSSQLPFWGCCLGMVPYLSAYVWWTADSSKNCMSSLFIDFRCWRKESLTELCHWIKIPWPKFWSYISFISTLLGAGETGSHIVMLASNWLCSQTWIWTCTPL